MTNINTIIEEEKMSTVDEVIAEFQLVHNTKNLWKDETGETAFVPIGNLEEWIRQLVVNRDAHWQHAMQRAYEAGQASNTLREPTPEESQALAESTGCGVWMIEDK